MRWNAPSQLDVKCGTAWGVRGVEGDVQIDPFLGLSTAQLFDAASLRTEGFDGTRWHAADLATSVSPLLKEVTEQWGALNAGTTTVSESSANPNHPTTRTTPHNHAAFGCLCS